MTAILFIACFISAALWYASNGTMTPWGMTIYTSTSLAVLVCALAFALRQKSIDVLTVSLALVANYAVGHGIWAYAPDYLTAVLGQGILHMAVLLVCVYATSARLGVVVGLLMAVNVMWAGLQLMGVLPQRERVFTGFYYPDLMAYTSLACSIALGMAGGDSGKRLRNWLQGKRYAAKNRSNVAAVRGGNSPGPVAASVGLPVASSRGRRSRTLGNYPWQDS